MTKGNGSLARKHGSWIDEFVKTTEGLETPEIFRRWSAITAIGGVLEQKVWLNWAGELYPNIYCMLVGFPGSGKTRSIIAVGRYLRKLQDFHIPATSLTSASLVDALVEAKRTLIRMPQPPIEYNSMMLLVDEIGAFLHKDDHKIFDMLSAFYNVTPYGENRRGRDFKPKIERPQCSILGGATPSVLMKILPDIAWEQGFCSRVMMIFSDERIIAEDTFASPELPFCDSLVHDLQTMNVLHGQFEMTQDYRDAVNNWRHSKEYAGPTHPKLLHYGTRRIGHFLKLCMVSAIDRGNVLLLTVEDFNRAMAWLLEAEDFMPDVFKAGSIGSDSKAMDEIHHFVETMDKGKGVIETRIVNFARERMPAQSIKTVLEVMERAGLIKAIALDRSTNTRVFKALAQPEP